MSGTVRLRQVTLGSGPAKIAAPLCATTPADLLREADAVVAAGADVAEWRIDYLLAARGLTTPPDDLVTVLAGLRERLGDIPLLATVRTAAEGGEVSLRDAELGVVVRALIEAAGDGAGHDAVDVELARGEVLPDAVTRAHELGVVVIASAHHFDRTPPRAEMLAELTRMAEAGADVAKLAVMAHDPMDVLELLAATHEATQRLAVPVITMAMGPDGVVSRLAGEVFGSVLTFGAVTRASAPGQVDVARLRDAVALVHETGHTPTDVSGG